MKLSTIKQVYVLGMGGVGVSAVAKLLQRHGVTVVGSDPHRNPLVEDLIRAGATYFADESPEHLPAGTDLLVYTDDAHEQHPIRQRAAALGIPAQNFSVTLDLLMRDYRQRIAIAGTNGKSTTTALTGLLLAGAGLDPTVFVGSRLTEFDGNVRLGSQQIFVAEADEYRDHFLHLRPTTAVITNVELDHVDYFRTPQRLWQSFHDFGSRLDPSHLIVNADDQSLAKHFPQAVTFGLADRAQLRAINLQVTAGQQTFQVLWREQNLGLMTLHVPGKFNVANALAALAAALIAGAEPTTFASTLGAFRGIWRRFQILTAPTSPVTIVNDYAHHPTAVRVTLAGAREFFPGRRLVAVFQPHHHNRLTALFADFQRCFGAADQTLIVETYTVPGREPQTTDVKTSQQLVAALVAQGQMASYAASPLAAEAWLRHLIQPGDVVLIMGAGDIWRMAEQLAALYA